MERKVYKVKIGKKSFELKVTLGFWKNCGFKREEAQVITQDPDAYLKALKLAIFYGNKAEYGWEQLSDMDKMLPESVFEDLEEDYSDSLSMCMVHYLPEKLRKVIIDQMENAEKVVEEAIENAMGSALNPDKEPEDKKKES